MNKPVFLKPSPALPSVVRILLTSPVVTADPLKRFEHHNRVAADDLLRIG